jgi:hypothetical protein
MSKQTDTTLSPALERKRLVPLRRAAELRGQSIDSTKRHLKDKIIHLGPRSPAVRLEDALELPPLEK